jgi:hypothetical protein
MTKFCQMLKKKQADGGTHNHKKKPWVGNKKSAPPQPHEHSKRTINGADMWYNKHTKHWVPNKDSNTPGAHAAGANQPVAKMPPAPAAPAGNISLANQLKALQATFVEDFAMGAISCVFVPPVPLISMGCPKYYH